MVPSDIAWVEATVPKLLKACLLLCCLACVHFAFLARGDAFRQLGASMVSPCTVHAQQFTNSQVGMHDTTIQKTHNSQQDVLAHVLKHFEYINKSHVRLMLFKQILKLKKLTFEKHMEAWE